MLESDSVENQSALVKITDSALVLGNSHLECSTINFLFSYGRQKRRGISLILVEFNRL